MQNTSPMHLNTSPACFDGSGTGKREKIHKTLKNLKLAPKKQLGIYAWLQRTPSPIVFASSTGPFLFMSRGRVLFTSRGKGNFHVFANVFFYIVHQLVAYCSSRCVLVAPCAHVCFTSCMAHDVFLHAGLKSVQEPNKTLWGLHVTRRLEVLSLRFQPLSPKKPALPLAIQIQTWTPARGWACQLRSRSSLSHIVGLGSFFGSFGRAGASELLSLGIQPLSLQNPALPLAFRLQTWAPARGLACQLRSRSSLSHCCLTALCSGFKASAALPPEPAVRSHFGNQHSK